jgi:hypothetical protein
MLQRVTGVLQGCLTNNTFDALSSIVYSSRKQGCYRVLQGVTGCYRVLQGVTGCYRVLQGVTGCYRVLQGVTGCNRGGTLGVFSSTNNTFDEVSSILYSTLSIVSAYAVVLHYIILVLQ